jgi:nitroimidazol reductase NimA-like FMN-containing flavoprotein (pyridoxamine 5'-phosphate oxidase superfamily)
MAGKEPLSAEPLTADAATVIPWAEARTRLAEARFYWLATVHPDGRPHVRPVLAVWVDGALHSTTNPTARKGRNLARDSRCAITVRSEGLDLVVEGEAAKVSDEAKLQRVADAYVAKYEWPVTVREGAFDAEYGAPAAGPPPYEVYEVTPSVVFGFGTDETLAPRTTRWQF